MLLKDFVSPVYWNLIPEVLELEIPEEKFATCNDCHYCQSPSEPKSLTKCCDYHPTIPNYMVGAILSDETGRFEEGKKRIRNAINQGAGITPNGILQPLLYLNDHKRIRKSGVYLNNKEDAKALKCPFYQEGNCTIYAYRTEICSTFFCHSVAGKTGQKFWKNFLLLLRSVENKLAIFSMSQLDYNFLQIGTRFPDVAKLKLENEKGVVNNTKYSKMWQDWEGKEIEFYIRSFEVIQNLTKDDVFGFLGLEDKLIIENCKFLSVEMTGNLIPDFLIFNDELQLEKDKEGNLFIKENGEYLGFSSLDLLNIKLFDGNRSTYEVIRKATLLRSNFSNKIPRLMEIGLLNKQ